MATAELNHTDTLPLETDERGAATTEESPYEDLFSGLHDDEKTPEEKAEGETPPQEEGEKPEEVAEEKADEQPPEETPVEPEKSDEPQFPGVSLAMREVAISSGLPAAFVDNLYDDAQVQVYLDMRRTVDTAEQDTSLTAKLLISDEEFDAQDPVHAQLKHLVDVSNQSNKEIREEIRESTDDTRRNKAEREQNFKTGLFAAYDKALDTLDQDIIGKSGSDARRKSWDLFEAMLAKNPDGDYGALAIQAARATHDKLVTAAAVKAQQQNLDKQKTKTLGGGASPRPIETPTEAIDDFKNFLRSLPSTN